MADAVVVETTEPEGIFHALGLAVRRPEAFAGEWRKRLAQGGKQLPMPWLLFASTTACLAIYGLTMGLPHGLAAMGGHALVVPAAAVLAWSVSLPALYVLGTLQGSRLSLRTTVLAALVAVHFGAVARLASAPLSWFFGLALPNPMVMTVVHALVFGVTALGMADVFLRVMKALDPGRNPAMLIVWLGLVALIDVELKVVLSVFAF